jgi:hypothetical protein
MGVYLVGIPLQGSPSALHTLFVVCTLLFIHHHTFPSRGLLAPFVYCSLFIHHCMLSVCCCPSYVVVHRCTLFIVCHSSYVVCHMLFICYSYIVCSLFVCHHTLFIHHSYVIVRHSYASHLCMSSYVIHLSSFIHCSYIVICHWSLYVVVCYSSFIICCSSFIHCPCGNEPRNRVENSLLVTDKKNKRYKKTHPGPKRLLSSFGPTFLPVD